MTARVIIAKSLRASETLKKRICGQDHLLDLLNTAILTTRDRGNVLHDPFRSLSLPSTRLSRYYNTLIFVISIHVIVCTLCDAENMWRHFKSILPPISFNDVFGVNAKVYSTTLRTEVCSHSKSSPRKGLTEIKTAPI